MLPFTLAAFPDILRKWVWTMRVVSRVTCESHTAVLVLHLGRLRKMGLAASDTLIHSDLPGLKLISKGKVRDIYETSNPNHLLFVASDRISAYDVIMKNVREPPRLPVLDE